MCSARKIGYALEHSTTQRKLLPIDIELRDADPTRGAIRQIDFSPDGELIAFTGEEQAIYIVSIGCYCRASR